MLLGHPAHSMFSPSGPAQVAVVQSEVEPTSDFLELGWRVGSITFVPLVSVYRGSSSWLKLGCESCLSWWLAWNEDDFDLKTSFNFPKVDGEWSSGLLDSLLIGVPFGFVSWCNLWWSQDVTPSVRFGLIWVKLKFLQQSLPFLHFAPSHPLNSFPPTLRRLLPRCNLRCTQHVIL